MHKKTTKKPVDLPSADLNAEEVTCDAADISGETLHFLLSLNDCSVDGGRLDRCCCHNAQILPHPKMQTAQV